MWSCPSEKGYINSFLLKYFSFTSFLSYFSLSSFLSLHLLCSFFFFSLSHHSSLKNSKSAIHHDVLSTKSYTAFSSVQLSRVRIFATPWTTAHQPTLSITNSRSPPKPRSIESVIPSNRLNFCCPFSSHLESFPSSGSFQKSQLFASCGQSIGVSDSTSVLPMNIHDWSLLGWTGWISLQSKGLSRVFPNSTIQKHQFCTQLSL